MIINELCELNHHEKFVEDLQSLLVKYFEFKEELPCRTAAASLMLEGINMMYQNVPDKTIFKEWTVKLFNAVLEAFLKGNWNEKNNS